MSTHALLVMDNLGVVEAFFEGNREVLEGSGHTDDMVWKANSRVTLGCKVVLEVTPLYSLKALVTVRTREEL
jgi:hypothetical protein